MLADSLASLGGLKFFVKGDACLAKGDVAGAKAVIIKPLSYMNLSGAVVARFMREFNVPVERVLVAYDDCDLPLGKMRFRKNGGSGGHHGVTSIIHSVGSGDFSRLRLGVGRPAEGELKDYVLSPFSGNEKPALDEALGRAVTGVEVFLREGVDVAMNGFN
jgi:PTH1 family peptidyl-tRNA hydrolase